MTNRRLIAIGGIGSLVALLCCLTPLLPLVLGGLGLSWLLSILYNDFVLLPLAFVFLCILALGLWRAYRGR